MDSFYDTGDMLADYGKEHGDSLINRLMFSHQVTALEAYLGDTLMNVVKADVGAMQRLIENDRELAKKKFSLAEMLEDCKLVERKVQEHLRSILYHNLAKVDVLYNIATGIRILHLVNAEESLFRAVMLRHDCVHRNGFDKDGNKLNIFTKGFVQDQADMIKTFVESIENAVGHQSVGAS
jgi:hypothetical protein